MIEQVSWMLLLWSEQPGNITCCGSRTCEKIHGKVSISGMLGRVSHNLCFVPIICWDDWRLAEINFFFFFSWLRQLWDTTPILRPQILKQVNYEIESLDKTWAHRRRLGPCISHCACPYRGSDNEATIERIYYRTIQRCASWNNRMFDNLGQPEISKNL
jgi:hypothetical protein